MPHPSEPRDGLRDERLESPSGDRANQGGREQAEQLRRHYITSCSVFGEPKFGVGERAMFSLLFANLAIGRDLSRRLTVRLVDTTELIGPSFPSPNTRRERKTPRKQVAYGAE